MPANPGWRVPPGVYEVKPNLRSIIQRAATGLLGLVALVVSARGDMPGETIAAESFKIPLWDYSTALRGSLGYKDNVLLSHTNAQGSAFWMSGAELMIIRLPTHGWQFAFFAEATDARYFDAPTVNNEQMALAVAQLSKDFGGGWKSTLGFNYLFQNQVFDNATTYTNQGSVGLILGHTVTPRWSARKSWDALFAEAEVSGTRQWLDAPLDSYWQFGPRAAVGWTWGRGSELALAYQFGRLNYDSREQLNATGGVVTNSALSLNSHVIELSLTANGGAHKEWQSSTAAGFEMSADNGSGFFDYNIYRLAQRVRYRNARWEITMQARAAYYDYATQTVSPTDASRRSKVLLSLGLRAERKLTKHLSAHASYSWERSISNLDFDDYAAGIVMGGLALNF